MSGFGPVIWVGVEGTGSYGVGLTRHFHTEGIEVVEVVVLTVKRAASSGSRIRSVLTLQRERRCPGQRL
jgi:glycine cleavage system H lipoate-binding protein